MSLNFNLADFDRYEPDVKLAKSPAFRTLIRNSSFTNRDDSLAIVSCGGTISSAYSPARENIRPTDKSPIADVVEALNHSFGTANKNISSISLIDKDSRDITIEDMKFLLDFLNSIKNKRIIVTCGTYGLPLFTQIIAHGLKTPNAIIGVTGSMLISSMREHDVDFNAGCVIGAVNAFAKIKDVDDNPHVFAAFHGKIYMADECTNLDLHPKSHQDVEFYRGQRLK